MDMTGYTKLFGSIVASTIWRESNEIRIVWITMLAMANKDGIVEASVPGLADMSRVTVQQCREAIEALQQPDPDSRTKDNAGRRISQVDGGWLILNHGKYRAKMGVDERREYLRVKQQEHRARAKLPNNGQGTPLARTNGYVYYAFDGKRYKIGFSVNPWARVWEFRTVNPAIELKAIEVGTMATEKDRHKQFEAVRHDREWFNDCVELQKFISSLPAVNIDAVTSTVSTHSESESDSAPEADAPKKGRSFDLVLSPEGRESVQNKAKGTKEQCALFAVEIGLPRTDGEAFFDKKEGTGWKGVKDWRSVMRNWKTEGWHPSLKKPSTPPQHEGNSFL